MMWILSGVFFFIFFWGLGEMQSSTNWWPNGTTKWGFDETEKETIAEADGAKYGKGKQARLL